MFQISIRLNSTSSKFPYNVSIFSPFLSCVPDPVPPGPHRRLRGGRGVPEAVAVRGRRHGRREDRRLPGQAGHPLHAGPGAQEAGTGRDRDRRESTRSISYLLSNYVVTVAKIDSGFEGWSVFRTPRHRKRSIFSQAVKPFSNRTFQGGFKGEVKMSKHDFFKEELFS